MLNATMVVTCQGPPGTGLFLFLLLLALVGIKSSREGFPGGAVVKNPPANAGDVGSSPGTGRSHMPQSN